MKWLLLWWVLSSAGVSASSASGFDSKAACESALQQITWFKGDWVKEVGGTCVPSEIPPAAPHTGRSQ